jgi:tetratricopeptide (TPR) repeat protein
MREVYFSSPGRFRFAIELERLEVASVDVLLEQSTHKLPLGTPSLETIGTRLYLGVLSFSEGNIEAAVGVFRQVVQQFPHSPDALNNLGFALLTAGKFEEALDFFRRAKGEGYVYSEFLEANVACCYYGLGRSQEAFAVFPTLMRAPLRSPGGFLLALGRSKAESVQLQSNGDYISLMALNAGRSAFAAGLHPHARTFAQIANAGLVTFPKTPSGQVFTSKLQELMEDIVHSDNPAR